MSHKIFRWFVSLILGLAITALTSVPQPAHAAGPWYVSTTGDDSNDCISPDTPCATINGTIGKAADGDTIKVAIGTYTSTATNGAGVVWINRNITLALLGGWDENFTTQNGMSTIDGQWARGGIDSISSGNLTVDHFAIQNGNNGGIVIESSGSPPATLILSHSMVSNNFNDYGGGINIYYGTVTLNNSTVDHNAASTSGGGIYIYGGTVTLNNSTISGNTAQAQGGGMYYYLNTSLDINNSSIVNNSSNQGGGIYRYSNSGTVALSNSILANNTATTDPDCTGTIDTSDHNIIGNTSGCTISASVGDQLDVNPLLSPYLIGAPGYHALVTGSPAIDAGDPATCLNIDQRGLARPQGSACDVGAYEYTTSGTAASFGISTGSNQRFPLGISLPIPFVIYVVDNLGSPVSGITVTFTAPVSGPSGTFADSGTNTTTAISDSSGLAVASVFTANNEAGNFTVNATAASLPGSVIFALSDSNDNFVSATVISTLPFSDSVDNTQATNELNEPQWCYISPNTVWYSFTPATSGAVRVDMAGTNFSDTILNIYQAIGSGIDGLSHLQCTTDFGDSGYTTFSVQAGVTYYLQAGSYNGGSGNLHLNMQAIPPPQNDNFANATVIPSPIPFDDTVDTLAASLEAGEPRPSCAYIDPGTPRSVWYAFMPTTTGAVSASIPTAAFTLVFAAYTGNSLANLNEVGCQTGGNLLTLNMNAGTTYYFQVGNLFPWEQGGSMQFHLDVAPLPVANFYFNPSDPSKYDTIQFYDGSYDPANIGIDTWEWNLGDGNLASGSSPTHKYTADGDYQVIHAVTTVDGRTASIIQTVQVRTHDVTVTKVMAPKSANVGQPRAITVSVRNLAYPETVTVDLYKSTPAGDVWIGSLTLQVPVLPGNKTKQFTFKYTFTSQDAQIGKVTFRAVATINGSNDAFPQDNTAISSPPTRVSR